MTESQAATTRICARLVGPIMVVVGAIVIARGGDLALIIPAILQDSPLAFVTGVFTLIAGMTLLTFHHNWTNITAIIITLLAIFMAIRGVILMFAPSMLAGFVHAVLTGPGPAIIIGGPRPGNHHWRRDRTPHRRMADVRRLVCQARGLSLHQRPYPGGRALGG